MGARPLWEDLGEGGEEFQVIGGFAVLGRLGEGGMGEVFRARQLSTGRVVAVKLLRKGISSARFRHEIDTVARLSHPGLVPILHAGEHEGRPFYAMELVEGPNLARHAVEHPVHPREVAGIIAAVAKAVHHAHERGVLHRDLKPQNVLLAPGGVPRVTDFGLARNLDGESTQLTRSGAPIGTPAYMAPEQVAGARARECPATDVYGLGVMLYQLLAGVLPFPAETVERTFRLILEEEPPALRVVRPGVDPDLETIVLACLEKDPSRRYPSALAVAEELERWLAGAPILRRPIGPIGRVAKWCRRKPVVAALALATGVTLISGATGVLWQWSQARAANARLTESVGTLSQFKAETLFNRGEFGPAIRELAGVLRQQPASTAIADRLIGALSRRRILLPVRELGPAPGPVDNARWAPDESRVLLVSVLATNRHLRQLTLWDRSTGRRLGPPVSLGGEYGEVQFSPDGRWIASAFAGQLQIHLGTNLAPAGLPLVNTASNLAFAWHPDSTRVLASTGGREAVLFDVRTGDPVVRYSHDAPVTAVAISPDGRLVAAGDSTGQISVWLADSATPAMPPFSVGAAVVGLFFDPHRPQLVATFTGALDGAAIVDLISRRTLATHPGIATVTWSRDGTHLLGRGRVARWVDAASGRLIREWAAGDDTIFFPEALIPGTEQLVSTRGGNNLALFDPARNTSVSEVVHHPWVVSGVEVSPSGRRAIVCADDPSVVEWDLTPGTLSPLRLPIGGSRLALAPDGKSLAVGGAGKWAIYGVDSWQAPRFTGAVRGSVKVVVYSPTGRRLLVGADAEANPDVQLWDVVASKLVGSLRLAKSRPTSAAFSPDEAMIATLSGDAHLQFWRGEDGRPMTPPISLQAGLPEGYGRQGFEVAFSPDGRRVYAGAYNGFVTVWNAGTTNRVGVLDHDLEPVFVTRLDRVGRYLATGTSGGSARIWELGTDRALSPRLRHGLGVSTVDSSPDGRRLATGGLDSLAQVWQVPDGRWIAVARGHTDMLTDVKFSPDGRRLATSSRDGTVRIWDPATGLPVDETVAGFGGGAARLVWLQDGRQIVVASEDRQASVVPAQYVTGPAPDWLPDLADAIAGETQDHSPGPRVLKLRDRLKDLPGDDCYSRWARWFFGDRESGQPF